MSGRPLRTDEGDRMSAGRRVCWALLATACGIAAVTLMVVNPHGVFHWFALACCALCGGGFGQAGNPWRAFTEWADGLTHAQARTIRLWVLMVALAVAIVAVVVITAVGLSHWIVLGVVLAYWMLVILLVGPRRFVRGLWPPPSIAAPGGPGSHEDDKGEGAAT